MKCELCNLTTGINYRNQGTAKCAKCGQVHDLTGEIYLYLGKFGRKHSFQLFRKYRICSCGGVLDTVWVDCKDAPEINKEAICRTCEGRGHGDGDMEFFVCPRCDGSGNEPLGDKEKSIGEFLVNSFRNIFR